MLFWSALFFGVCGAMFLRVASNGGEMRLFPTAIQISGAPVYAFAFAALSFGFVGLATASYVVNRRRGVRELVIADDAFEVPKNVWSAATHRVERVQVQRFATQSAMGTKTVSIITSTGPVHVSNRMVGENGYQALRAWLQHR